MYDLISRVTDFLQIIQLILIPALIEAIPDAKKKMLSFIAVFLLNGFLLYVDCTANLKRISDQFNHEYTLTEYPYVTVFETDRVNYYVNLINLEERVEL